MSWAEFAFGTGTVVGAAVATLGDFLRAKWSTNQARTDRTAERATAAETARNVFELENLIKIAEVLDNFMADATTLSMAHRNPSQGDAWLKSDAGMAVIEASRRAWQELDRRWAQIFDSGLREQIKSTVERIGQMSVNADPAAELTRCTTTSSTHCGALKRASAHEFGCSTATTVAQIDGPVCGDQRPDFLPRVCRRLHALTAPSRLLRQSLAGPQTKAARWVLQAPDLA